MKVPAPVTSAPKLPEPRRWLLMASAPLRGQVQG